MEYMGDVTMQRIATAPTSRTQSGLEHVVSHRNKPVYTHKKIIIEIVPLS